MSKAKKARCRWITLREALQAFVQAKGGHKGQQHIKPLHCYIACRLVLEGGFLPDEITPRPPFVATRQGSRWILSHDAATGGTGEQTVLGGLKTKNIDVVVSKTNVGPCLAVSLKGTLNAFRNLTNRLEEAAGDCTNLHMVYPALVYGFWSLIRANRPGLIPADAAHILKPATKGDVARNEIRVEDLAIRADGRVTSQIVQYAHALEGIAGRTGVRDDVSKYEAVAMAMVSPDAGTLGEVLTDYPEANSVLDSRKFFTTLLSEYDLRFVYQAPKLAPITRRHVWDAESPALTDPRIAGIEPRVGEEEPPEAEDELSEAEQGEDEEES
jgi:hypothetical protein